MRGIKRRGERSGRGEGGEVRGTNRRKDEGADKDSAGKGRGENGEGTRGNREERRGKAGKEKAIGKNR